MMTSCWEYEPLTLILAQNEEKGLTLRWSIDNGPSVVLHANSELANNKTRQLHHHSAWENYDSAQHRIIQKMNYRNCLIKTRCYIIVFIKDQLRLNPKLIYFTDSC